MAIHGFVAPPVARRTENYCVFMHRLQNAIRGITVSLGLLAAWPLSAGPVGERVLIADYEQAAPRNADGSRRLRITVWYPAIEPAETASAPSSGNPLMESLPVLRGAPPQGSERRPTILLSHGFGGAAQAMSWFGVAMAAHGYLVIAVDHPGNNGREEMTRTGAAMFFERPGDLETALQRVVESPDIGTLVDRNRVAVAGFSAGGFTALALAGGEVDPARLRRFCQAQPSDGVCRPQLEFAVPIAEVLAILESTAARQRLGEIRRHRRPFEVRAALVMAPAIVQSFDPQSLRSISARATFVLGEADTVAPNGTNGLVAARRVPRSRTRVIADAVHYDFLAVCTAAGRSALPFCALQEEAEAAHRTAINEALALFGEAFGTRAPN